MESKGFQRSPMESKGFQTDSKDSVRVPKLSKIFKNNYLSYQDIIDKQLLLKKLMTWKSPDPPSNSKI